MEVMATDILGPLPQMPNGNKYVLVVSDYFTCWCEAFPIPNQEATTVANTLVEEVSCGFRLPGSCNDQERQFESVLVAEVCRLLGIQKSHTTAYHPQGDGLVERFNCTLLDMLATCTREHPTTWESHLRKVCFAYNASEHPTTGFSPAYLMFGRELTVPVDLMYGPPPSTPQSPSQYVDHLQSTLVTAFDTVRRHHSTGRRPSMTRRCMEPHLK